MNSFETARSNGFRVRDTEAFLAWANDLSLEATAVQEIPGDYRFVLTPGPGRDPVQLFASLHNLKQPDSFYLAFPPECAS